ncbi:MAG: asparagine synthase (glutamine-hydrolyzing) [Hyphomicrobiales bacterium]|nr:asparagine synthase (glutamine-hydrolyzing) [Hyphomicrobiales bacterium]
MCGIAGIVLGHPDPSLAERFERLAFQYLEKRGPDGRGSKTIDFDDSARVNLYHTRLSIIDIAGGAQPMSDAKGSLVFNGEIYNFQDLRDPAFNYRTRSDTEVLLHGLSQYGLDFLNRTDGMFAFAYVDEARRTLTIARDAFGIKSAYVCRNGSTLAFSSNLPPLMALSRKQVNGQSLMEYYMSRGMRGSHTIFDDIMEVPPGHAYQYNIDTGEGALVRWSAQRQTTRRNASEEELTDELEAILDRSVQRHLISDVPVAALLSGGIDSSLMTALAARHTPHLSAFTIGFTDEKFDESPFAAAVARRYGLKHSVYYCEDNDFVDLIEDWPIVLDDAVANPSSVLLYAVSQFARDAGHKVLLAGEGADEFFGGYHQQWRFAQTARFNRFAKPFRFAANALEKAAPHKTRLVHNAHLATGDEGYQGTSTIIEPWLADRMFANERQRHPGADNLKDAIFHDQDHRLPDDMLTAADRATMHASVEARVPFVTREVADFAASLDSRHLISGMTQKALLRKVARRHVPAMCIDRRKVGFDLPLARWFRTSLRERLMDALSTTWQQPYFKPGALEQMIGWHMSGKANLPDKLWAFWMLENNVRKLKAIA